MRTLEEAKSSLKRVTFNEEQRERSKIAFEAVNSVLDVFFATAQTSPELTLACRALQEASMWHSVAIANESKK